MCMISHKNIVELHFCGGIWDLALPSRRAPQGACFSVEAFFGPGSYELVCTPALFLGIITFVLAFTATSRGLRGPVGTAWLVSSFHNRGPVPTRARVGTLGQ